MKPAQLGGNFCWGQAAGCQRGLLDLDRIVEYIGPELKLSYVPVKPSFQISGISKSLIERFLWLGAFLEKAQVVVEPAAVLHLLAERQIVSQSPRLCIEHQCLIFVAKNWGVWSGS